MPAYSPYSASQKLELINKARNVLRGEYMEIDDLVKLRKELELNDQFAYATEVLLQQIKADEEQNRNITVKEYQELAKCIYKDSSLPSAFKFEKALQQLNAHLDLQQTTRCETLGLAGAIYKRKWQYDHQFRNLILSQLYYRKGFDNWQSCIKVTANNPGAMDQNDEGYTGINFAYICELMANDKLEEYGKVSGFTKSMASDLQEAKEARQYILDTLLDEKGAVRDAYKQFSPDKINTGQSAAEDKAWVLSTIAEAYFGIGNYTKAIAFVKQYITSRSNRPWEVRTFNQQLLSIAYLQVIRKKGYDDAIAKQAEATATRQKVPDYPNLAELKEHTSYISSDGINACLNEFKTGHIDTNNSTNANYRGLNNSKWGLALSGGGFRASLFHIGVLAALAEEDKLKDVEVLSCVSGGSIIGAYYYLKLKLLLESKTDCQVDKHDYINLVKEIETDFLEGVQQNLRMRIFSNLFLNLRMVFDKNYSRTHRLGSLYEKYLFKKIMAGQNALKYEPKYKELLRYNNGEMYMNDLFITPKLEPGEHFNFTTDNWLRKNKIPQLVLNATSVNTGHNWQFTASWMGEPAGSIEADIDVKPRLRRMYYEDAPAEYQKFRLGYAVGASSCVPVMFKPMPMYNLYPGIDLQLIDGGLHDNQGIGALIDNECANMIVSDASGQLPTGTASLGSPLSVFWRADSILQERLRELQFKDIKEREATTQVASLLTLHLKKGLQQEPKSWLYCTDPPRRLYDVLTDDNTDLTQYGILRTVQNRLSEIRTDLDSFNDTEAYALMYSGWCQTKQRYHPTCNMEECLPTESGWKFLNIKNSLTIPAEAAKIDDLLSAAKNVPFKLWYISKVVRWSLIAIGVIIGVGFIYYLYHNWDNDSLVSFSLSAKALTWLLVIYLIGLLSKVAANILNYKSYVRRKLIDVGLAFVGFIVCWLYVSIFNPLYNRLGRLIK